MKPKLRSAPGRFGALRARWHKRLVVVARLVCVAIAIPPTVLLAMTAFTELPAELREAASYGASVRVLDRDGKILSEVRANDGARARWVRLEEVGPYLPKAIIAAEDQRFYIHPGIDPVAIARAGVQNLWHGRIVSGASTLTQQLGRNLVQRPRTLPGKVKEMAVALRIEASLSKQDIVEAYLNLVPFGPSLRGVEAASRFYFDKPCASLSLGEAATLAAMPRAPALYDPRRATPALLQRRDLILSRMQASGGASNEEVERAKNEPITAYTQVAGWSAPHLVRGLLAGTAEPRVGKLEGRVSVLHTTLDARLQREAQTAARSLVRSLAERSVSAAAVVVIENASGEVLAWVGAHDFLDDAHFGQNDGVIALRQPGSALKPFVYSVAMDELGWNGATLLRDTELHLPEEQGTYSPQNYDGRYHGPVRLREALANSLNVPAVLAASSAGPARVLSRLRDVGLTTLYKSPDHYGAAIALGDGEVRLLDLTNAYATLARGGILLPVHAVRSGLDPRGGELELPRTAEPVRVMPATTAALLLDILSDPDARQASFGADSVLELPFPVAAKTGTSKGFRDNLTVGASSEVTVGVWVGNFDGSAMQGVSGVTGAGPLFRTVMMSAMQNRIARPLNAAGPDFERIAVCALSGRRATALCPHPIEEPFARGHSPDRACAMHAEFDIDTSNGLLAGPGCPHEEVRRGVFEVFEPSWEAWAASAGRLLAPKGRSPRCPGENNARGVPADFASRRVAVQYPPDGAVFLIDPGTPGRQQAIVLRAIAAPGASKLRFLVDGSVVGSVGLPFEAIWTLVPGKHLVQAETEQGERSEEVWIEVR